MNDKFSQLKKDIEEVKNFKSLIERQQLNFPLDKSSADIAHKDVITPTGYVVFPYNVVSYDDAVEIMLNGKKYLIDSSSIH